MPATWEPKWYARLRDLCDGARSYVELARLLGKDAHTVYQAVKKLKLPEPEHGNLKAQGPASPALERLLKAETQQEAEKAAARTELVAKMRKMRDEGFTLAEIGEAMSLSRQRVHQILKEEQHAEPPA